MADVIINYRTFGNKYALPGTVVLLGSIDPDALIFAEEVSTLFRNR
jgi:hypothetical protein